MAMQSRVEGNRQLVSLSQQPPGTARAQRHRKLPNPFLRMLSVLGGSVRGGAGAAGWPLQMLWR